VAARGHEVHIVAPWHPLVTRGREEHGVFFHFFKYAPLRALDVFGYAAGMRADVRLRGAAWIAAPLAMTAGWFKAMRVAGKRRATIMHGHWVVPGGAIAAAAGPRLPPARAVARRVLQRAGFVTACSADLSGRAVALGAAPDRLEVVPYGVDTRRFRPDLTARIAARAEIGIDTNAPLLVAAGRLVRKKGFEYLIDAMAAIDPPVTLAIAGAGDLAAELDARARAAGVGDRVRFLGNVTQDAVGRWFAAADVAVVPSVRDDRGNVDGLPNTVLEALATGTPVVATPAGGIGAVIENGVSGVIVPEREPAALAAAISDLLRDRGKAAALGRAARTLVDERFGWAAAAARFEAAYDRALAFTSTRR
ncbi:MAG: glycosyltransferase family 4 protein, partial [Acidobacteria bacterium]|nr:glycosyltransferase family 4 protein [Acidobacteriota bacterium]